MKKLSFCLLIIFCSLKTYSQEDYYIKGQDTIRVSNLTYDLTMQSYLAELSYTDTNGKPVTVKGRKNLSDVSTLYINYVTIDKIPQKAHKPKGYVKWAHRVVYGKLIVDYYTNSMTTSRAGSRPVTTSITKFFIKMPDGTFYDIRKSKDRKKHIIPYLQQCSEFVSAYDGNYSSDYKSFTEMILLYNSLCK